MKVTLTVFDVSRDSYTGKNGVVDNNVHLLQDASPGPKLKQFLEYSRPLTEKPLDVGSRVEVEIMEIIGLFGGRVRFRGIVNPVK